MNIANYYPQQNRLDLIGSDNMPVLGFIGPDAHLKAINLVAQGKTLVFTIIDSKLNKTATKSIKNA